MKYGELNLGQIEAIVNKLGGMEGALRLLRGETSFIRFGRNWREEDGIIYFSVTSDGATSEEWIERLESKGDFLGNFIKDVIYSKEFKKSSGIRKEIVVLKRMDWKKLNLVNLSSRDNGFVEENVKAFAARYNLEKIDIETACLIKEKFSDQDLKDMGLYYIVSLIDGDESVHKRLITSQENTGCWLDNFYGNSDYFWGSGLGFAFVAPQISGS